MIRRPFRLAALVICLLALLVRPAATAEPYPSIAMFAWQLDGPAETGFREGVLKRYPNARFYAYCAAEDPLLLERFLDDAAQRRHDLYYVSGTSAALQVLAREKEKPVVFTMVLAPVEEGVIASWDASENNTTGISSQVPILNQLKTLKRIVDFQRLGVLYNPTSPDARHQIRELERLQPFLGYTVVPIPIAAPAKALDLGFNRVADLDAVFLTQDPLIERLGHSIVAQINEAGLPSLAAELTLVTRRGALLGLVPDRYRIGRLAALSALRILDGTAPARIPSSALDFFMVVLNMRTAHQLDVQVPFSLLVMADTIVR
jgi:putative tryptophan/tyrosine transport system substrate-binding protein